MTERQKQYAVFGSSVGASLGVFSYALYMGNDGIAGRGGDIGMAITLGFLFVKADLGPRIFQVLRRDAPELSRRIRGQKAAEPPTPPTVEELERRIDLLARSITIEEQGQHRVDLLLAGATVLATALSAFGESWAAWFLSK